MRAINTASEFLNHMNAMIEFSDTAEVEYPASPDTITLLTAHKSKGKEFPTVVIYGVEEFEESEEGRNLLYVSMTRAKRNLFLLQGSFPMPHCIRSLKTMSIDRCRGILFTHRYCVKMGYGNSGGELHSSRSP